MRELGPAASGNPRVLVQQALPEAVTEGLHRSTPTAAGESGPPHVLADSQCISVPAGVGVAVKGSAPPPAGPGACIPRSYLRPWAGWVGVSFRFLC